MSNFGSSEVDPGNAPHRPVQPGVTSPESQQNENPLSDVRMDYAQIRALLDADPRLTHVRATKSGEFNPSMLGRSDRKGLGFFNAHLDPEQQRLQLSHRREVLVVSDDVPMQMEKAEALPDYDQLLAPIVYSAEDFANDFYHITFPKNKWSGEVLSDEVDKAQDVYKRAVTPDEKEALSAYAEFHEWSHFARPGSPLPDDFILVENPMEKEIMPGFTRCPKVVPHPKSILNVNEAASYVYEMWGAKLYHADVDLQKETRAAMRKLIMATPVYRLLHSFRAEGPSTTERPLTPQEIMARKSEILDHIYQHHSLDKAQPIDTEPGIRQEYGRAISLLEDETRFHRTTSSTEDPAAKRARAFFMAHDLQDAYLSHGPSEKVFKFIEELHLDSETAEPYSNSSRKSASHDLIKGVIGRIFAPGFESMTYDARLLTLLDEITHQLTHPYITHYETRDHFSRTEPRAAYNVERPDAPIMSFGEYETLQAKYEYRTFDRADQQTAYFTPREEAAEQDATILAHVEQKGHDPHSGYRLISAVNRDEDLQSDRSQATLLIQCNNNDIVPVGHDMFIPGYELVYRDDVGTFGFAKSEDDPYAPAEINLESSSVEKLISQYTSFGFLPLVDYLKTNPPQTVADLEKAVAETSTYMDTEEHYERRAEKLMQFVHFLRYIDQRLQFQCSGAALFMKASLNEVMRLEGKDIYTAVVDGHVLEPGSNVISAAKHAQTLLVIDGKQHILDATPSEDSVHEATQAMSIGLGGLRGIFKRRKRAPKSASAYQALPTPEVNDELSPANTLTPEVSDSETEKTTTHQPHQIDPEARATAIRSQETELLLNSLGVALNALNREQLLGKVSKLGDPDPLRKVAGFALRLQNGLTDSSEVTSLQSYVADYKKADKETRKRAGLPEYDNRLLTILESYLANISS